MEIMDFYADWCGPCQMMKPIIAEFEEAHPEIKVRAVNVYTDGPLAAEYGVSGVPCIVFLKDGKEVNRSVGVTPLRKLEELAEV